MLTQKYYDAFAKIFSDKFYYELSLYNKHITKQHEWLNRRVLIEDVMLEFIAFMKDDNSNFDEIGFRLTCGLDC